MKLDELDLGLFSPLTVGDDFWESGHDDVDAVLGRTGLTEGDRVLMIPRGAGQHAIAFAERGLNVTAVGPDDDSLELARARAQTVGVSPDFRILEEPTAFDLEGPYQLVMNLSSSFDFVQTNDGGGVLERIYSLVADGGYLILRMVSLDQSQRRVHTRDWSETKAGALLLEELEYDWSIGWVSYRWLVVGSDGRRYEFHLGHRGYDADWIRQALQDVGFSEVALYGSLGGDDFESDTPLVVVARK